MSDHCDSLLSYAQYFKFLTLLRPDAPFNSGHPMPAPHFLPFPSCHYRFEFSENIPGGLNSELPKGRNKEPKVSLSPLGWHLTKIWSGSEASRRMAENHNVSLKCLKAICWLEPAPGRISIQLSPCRITFSPGGMGANLPSPMAPGL